MPNTTRFYRASVEDFSKVPGRPVGYWLNDKMREVFLTNPLLNSLVTPSVGIQTGDNDKFIRYWWEIDCAAIWFAATTSADTNRSEKYYPYNKGGSYRKWEGNNEFVVNWRYDGADVRANADATGHHWQEYASELKFKPLLTWTRISGRTPAFRYKDSGFLCDMAGFSLYPTSWDDGYCVLGLLNSAIGRFYLDVLAPTVNLMVGPVVSLPYPDGKFDKQHSKQTVSSLIDHSRADWDSFETSWNFKENPLVLSSFFTPSDPLSELYAGIRARWMKETVSMRQLEIENNTIFIRACGLEDEFSSGVPWNEVSLSRNPWYRYRKKKKNEDEDADLDQPEIEGVSLAPGELNAEEFPNNPVLEARLRADTAKELISYAVGCMMGRYSLEKPGLVLAAAGGTIEDYRRILAGKPDEYRPANRRTFDPDEDGILPILDADWFEDDIVTRFHAFLRAAFGEANFLANVSWLESALGKDLRAYFVKDFYADHVQRYQKRPIYWLFSSKKGKFQALVYLHRYRPDTPGRVLGYLRSHIAKVIARIEALDRTAVDPNASRGAQTAALRERTKLAKAQAELSDYERDVLYPLSTERPALDLDDGVKANYLKLGAALRKIFN